MKRLATLLLVALLGAVTASAQTTFSIGGRSGGQLASTTSKETSGNYAGGSFVRSTSAILAWQVGVAFEARFGKFALQPAALFSQKGEKTTVSSSIIGIAGTDRSESSFTTRYNWLEIPLNLVYTLQGDHGIQLFAGPYIAFAVGGRETGSYTTYSWTSGVRSTEYSSPIFSSYTPRNRRIDAGTNVGLGYRKGPVQAQLAYGLGFSKLFRLTDLYDLAYYPGESPSNRVLQLTGTYFFSL